MARQEWFDKRKGKYIDTFYYEGEIKTMMRGGGKHLLDGNIELISNLKGSQKRLDNRWSEGLTERSKWTKGNDQISVTK